MMSYVSLVTATIDVTYRTALDICVGRSHKLVTRKFCCTEEVINASCLTTGIYVSVDLTAKYGNVGCAIYIASKRHVYITQTTTVGIAFYDCTLVDDDIGVMFLPAVQLCCGLVVQLRTVTEMIEVGSFVGSIFCICSSCSLTI